MEESTILDTSIAIGRKEGHITALTLIEYPPAAQRPFIIVIPEVADYAMAFEIASLLRKNGKPIGAVDILIAAMCINRSASLLTKDKDFKIIKEFFPEFRMIVK